MCIRDRLCYDHIAGRLGTSLTDALVTHGHVELGTDGGAVTARGEIFLHELGIDVARLRRHRRIFCKPCLDWSERRPHLAGAVGAALATRLLELRWITRVRDTRVLTVTPIGGMRIEETFGMADVPERAAAVGHAAAPATLS